MACARMCANRIGNSRIALDNMKLLNFSPVCVSVLCACIFWMLLGYGPGSAEASRERRIFSGEVVRVVDGDSLVVRDRGRDREVRLYGIDAPEWNQPYGREARDHMLSYRWKVVECEIMTPKDRYGREICILRYGGKCINEELVRLGLAWVWPWSCKAKEVCSRWSAAQDDAIRNRRGLWRDGNPEPPWEYRQRPAESSQAVPKVSPKAPVRRSAPYTGNVSSKIFHDRNCIHAECARCDERFDSREEALRKGFRPCRICRP